MAIPGILSGLALLLLLAGPLISHADDHHAHSQAPGAVLELTDGTFNAAIAKYDYILVDFYAPWCGHCKMLSPEMDAAAPRLAENNPPIVLAKINADKYTKLASKYGVSGYPTLKFFINGFPTDYNGPRKAASLFSHLQKIVIPDVKVLSTDSELEDFLEKAGDSFPFFIGFGLEESTVSELAKKHKSRAWFVVVKSFSEKAMVDYDFDKSPALIVLRPGHQEQEIFYGPFEGNDLAQFIKQNLLPRVNPVTIESIKNFKEDARPIALAILKDTSSEQSETFIKKLKAAAPANRAFIFAYVDAIKWPAFAETFHITGRSILPTVVIWDGDSNYFSSIEGFDFSGEKAEAYITLFLQEFKEGKAIGHKVKAPSFMEFVTSNISLKTVYILVFIVATIMFVQNIRGSDDAEIDQRQGYFRETRERKYEQSNPSKSSSSDTSSLELNSSVDTEDKED